MRPRSHAAAIPSHACSHCLSATSAVKDAPPSKTVNVKHFPCFDTYTSCAPTRSVALRGQDPDAAGHAPGPLTLMRHPDPMRSYGCVHGTYAYDTRAWSAERGDDRVRNVTAAPPIGTPERSSRGSS